MEKPSTARIALKWGVIASVLMIIYSVVLFMTGQHIKNQSLSYGSNLFLLGGMILAMKEYKLLNNGYLGFGEGLGLGTLISAVTGLISSIFTALYMTFIDTTIPQQISDMQREQLEARGMTQEQIEQAMEVVSKFSSPGMIFIIGLLATIFFGFILSLLVSAVMKKDKPQMNF